MYTDQTLLGLSAVLQDQIATVLSKHPHIELAYLFGSMARGRQTPASDVDLAVQAASVLTAEQTIALTEDVAGAIGRPVDIVDLRKAGEPLLGEVLRGVRIIGSDSLHAELTKRHIFDTEDFVPYLRRLLAERRRRWSSS